ATHVGKLLASLRRAGAQPAPVPHLLRARRAGDDADHAHRVRRGRAGVRAVRRHTGLDARRGGVSLRPGRAVVRPDGHDLCRVRSGPLRARGAQGYVRPPALAARPGHVAGPRFRRDAQALWAGRSGRRHLHAGAQPEPVGLDRREAFVPSPGGARHGAVFRRALYHWLHNHLLDGGVVRSREHPDVRRQLPDLVPHEHLSGVAQAHLHLHDTGHLSELLPGAVLSGQARPARLPGVRALCSTRSRWCRLRRRPFVLAVRPQALSQHREL
ncbi:MAG: hypothetical protein AVDCRST_MAG86-4341, partial [uncultured Truepera sp.]